jgi:hypothetical protein
MHRIVDRVRISNNKSIYFALFRLRPSKERSDVFAAYVKHFSDLKCSLLPSSFTTVTPLSVHVDGFESEQIYQQLQTINQDRFKPFAAALIKCQMKSKAFGQLLRSPSPVQTTTDDNMNSPVNDHADDDDDDDGKVKALKKSMKKKKSVTYATIECLHCCSRDIFSCKNMCRFYDQNALDKFLDEQDLEEMARYHD